MNVEQLKAKAYDCLVQIEFWQKQLNETNQAIQAQLAQDNAQAKTGGNSEEVGNKEIGQPVVAEDKK